MRFLILAIFALSAVSQASPAPYAQVKNGTIVNTIILDTAVNKTPWSQGFDCIAQISSLSGSAAIGWTTSDNCASFNPPAPPAPPVLTAQQKVQAAMAFGQQVIAEFGAGNIQAGLTTSQVAQVAQSLAPVLALLQTGSLNTALAAIQNIVPNALITQGTIDHYVAELQSYIAANP